MEPDGLTRRDDDGKIIELIDYQKATQCVDGECKYGAMSWDDIRLLLDLAESCRPDGLLNAPVF